MDKGAKRQRNRLISISSQAIIDPQSKLRATNKRISLLINNFSKNTTSKDVQEFIPEKPNVAEQVIKIIKKIQRQYDAVTHLASIHFCTQQ